MSLRLRALQRQCDRCRTIAKVFNRGALCLCREAWQSEIWQTLVIYSRSYFNLRGLELWLGG